MNEKYLELLRLLHKDEYTTAYRISQRLEISEKTARNYIKEVNELMSSYDIKIISKHGYGYKLIAENDKRINELIENKKNLKNHLPSNSSERKSAIILNIIKNPMSTAIEGFAKKLYVSRNTIVRDMSSISEILSECELVLKKQTDGSFKILGDEKNKRLFIVKNLNVYDIQSKSMYINLEKRKKIIDIINSEFIKKNIVIPEYGLEKISNYIYTAIDRLSHQEQIDCLVKCENTLLYKFSNSIFLSLCQEFDISYVRNEVEYLAIFISSNITSDNEILENISNETRNQMSKLVLEMLDFLYDSMQLDLRNDLELFMNLNQHMIPFDIRMRFNLNHETEIVEQIKVEYPYPYTVAHEICINLEGYYGKVIPDSEVVYFALIFALALDEKKRYKLKKNVLIVCPAGRATSQLFKVRYKQAFEQYINHMYECTITELETFDFKKKKVDYIFTTTKLEHSLHIPVYEVDLLPRQIEIEEYKLIFDNDNNKLLSNYYDKRLFIPSLECGSKEEALKSMCEVADLYYDIPENFYESILIRESLGRTDYGNDTAIPHTYKICTKENFVVVAILESPILWSENKVQVILLVAIAEERDKAIDYFYERTTELVFNKEKIESLKKNRKFENLIHLLET